MDPSRSPTPPIFRSRLERAPSRRGPTRQADSNSAWNGEEPLLAPFRTLLLLWLVWHGLAVAGDDFSAEVSQLISRHAQLHVPGTGTEDIVPVAPQGSETLARFYEFRAFAPVWSEPSRLMQLVAQIEDLADDGLRPEDYALAHLRRHARRTEPTAEQRACAEVLATRAYLDAVTDLAFGRLDPAEVEPLWRFERHSARPHDRARLVMEAAAGVDDIAAVFDRARPPQQQYRGLRQAYAAWRDKAASDQGPQVPPGSLLRAGTVAPRVVLLRARLRASGYDTGAAHSAEVYDSALAAAVMQFQRDHHLDADGIVGPATLAMLNIPESTRRDQLKANLERMRWLARDLEGRFVLVDVAGATISYFRDGGPVWSARAQIGQPARPTPLLKSQITHVTFNPTWTIPPTVLRQDKLPEIRRDLDYLARNQIRVFDYSGAEIAPEAVDWERPGAVLLRQTAGPHNALGKVAIRFPNPYSVYLHDTPSQRLFARQQRAFSSGCVRVERALELVDLLFDDGDGVERTRIGDVIASGRTRNIRLPDPVPVLIAYWTAHANAEGTVSFRPDLYDRDAALIRALAVPRALDTSVSCRTAEP